jgi:YNFM family putative membrane transporter
MTGPESSQHEAGLRIGSPGYIRALVALVIAGFTCFLVLYGTQPILPQITAQFGVTPATASLTVAAGTGAMALLLVPLSLFADRYGRERLMRWGLAGAAAFAVASAVAPDFLTLLACRAGVGACVAGVPAAALAYLGDEIAPEGRSRAMGLYIAATGLGGMTGRLIVSAVTGWLDWRYGLATLGAAGVLAAIVFWRLLPPAQRFESRSMQPRALFTDARQFLADPGVLLLLATGFLISGTLAGAYNFSAFRLSLPPYGLGPAAVGSLFLLYGIGSAASAWAGNAVNRLGRGRIALAMSLCMALGLAITLATPLPVIVLGLAVFTIGFFAVHAVASGWVGRRAGGRKGLVSALYLSCYYFGSSVIGSSAGWPWSLWGWPGVVAALMACMAGVIGIAIVLRRLADD